MTPNENVVATADPPQVSHLGTHISIATYGSLQVGGLTRLRVSVTPDDQADDDAGDSGSDGSRSDPLEEPTDDGTGGQRGAGGQAGTDSGSRESEHQPESPGNPREQPGSPGEASGGQPGGQQAGQPGRSDPPSGSGGQSDGGGSSLGRRIGLVVLGILLTASIAGAHGVFAAQSTVLDGGYVTDTLADQDVYGELEAEAESAVTEQIGDSVDTTGLVPSGGGMVSGVVSDVVTAEYIENQVSRNVETLYAYLHGRTDTLDLSIDPSPLINSISDGVATRIEEVPVADILQTPTIQDSFSGLGIDVSRIGVALEDEQEFRDLQDEIGGQLEGTGITADELNQSLRQELSLEQYPSDVRESVYRLQGTIVLGMTSDMSYDRFREKLESAREEMARTVGAYAQQQVRSQLGSEIDLTDQLDPDARQQLDEGAGYVQLADTLQLALPAVAIVLILVILGLSHSISATARTLGSSLLTVGVLGLIGSQVGAGQASSAIRDAVANEPAWVRSTANAIIDGLFETITTQSAVLAVLGFVCLLIWFGISRYEPDAVPATWR